MECQLDNITVFYETYGQGRPLILLPGWSLDARIHANLMEPYLQERDGWQRFYIDPPGHGRTLGADWVRDLDQMLDVLLDAMFPSEAPLYALRIDDFEMVSFPGEPICQ